MAAKLLPMTVLRPAIRGSFQIAVLALGVLASSGGYLCQAQVSAAASNSTPALPSGLAPASQLVVDRAQLALDSNGTLFRSDDGKHWHQVKQQWDGKAVELLGIPALTEAPGSGQAPRSDSSQQIYAAVLLRSTAQLHWVSLDRGKTWMPSTLDDVRRNDVKWSGN
jgi:hypothetical protein